MLDADAYSIPEFCRRNGGFSRSTFYNLEKAGKAPATIKIGSRTMVTREAAEAWRRRMEAESTSAKAA